MPTIALVGVNSYTMQPVSIRLPRRNARDASHYEIDNLMGLQFKTDLSGQIAGSQVLLVQDLAVPGNMTALKKSILATGRREGNHVQALQAFVGGDIASLNELRAQANKCIMALQTGRRPEVLARISIASSFNVASHHHDALPDPTRAGGRYNRRI